MTTHNPPVYLLDKVKLNDGSTAIVRFIGEIQGKNGIFYGVEKTKGLGKNNGTIKKVIYFQTKKNSKTGRMVRCSTIKSIIHENHSLPYTLGDEVYCPRLKVNGVIKYAGIPVINSSINRKKTMYGLVFSSAKGNCNGTIHGMKFFSCKVNHGLYINTDEIRKKKKIKKSKNKKKKQNHNLVISSSYFNYEQKMDANANKHTPEVNLKIELEKERQKNKENDNLLQQLSLELEIKDKEIENLQNTANILSLDLENIRNECKLEKEKSSEKTKEILNLNLKMEQMEKELDNYKNGNERSMPTSPKEIIEEKKDSMVEIERLKKELELEKESKILLNNKYQKAKTKAKKLKTQLKSNEFSSFKQPLEKSSSFRNKMEVEINQIKSEFKDGNSMKDTNERLNGMLTALVAKDIKSATVVLPEILKQWQSKFLTESTRMEYLLQFVQILKVMESQMDFSDSYDDGKVNGDVFANEEMSVESIDVDDIQLKSIVKQMVICIQECEENMEYGKSISATAKLCLQDPIVVKFLKYYNIMKQEIDINSEQEIEEQ